MTSLDDFELPSPGAGKLADFRRAGKAFGVACAKKTIGTVTMVEHQGAPTVQVDDLLKNKIIDDAVEITKMMRVVGYSKQQIDAFEQGILSGFKTVSVSDPSTRLQ